MHRYINFAQGSVNVIDTDIGALNTVSIVPSGDRYIEYPYQNEFWDHFAKGIYVDIVTGEPLFASTDKYESSCGWPAFTKPIEEPTIVEIEDNSHGMQRVEVRSRAGNSHLGHVFENDPESPNGIRYCINSASLRFIPYDEMEAEGYGYLMDIFE